MPGWVVRLTGIGDQSKPRGYDFTHSCNRHDFAYSNYKLQDRFQMERNRKRLDDNWQKDMFAVCDREGDKMEDCRLVASMYHLAVRALGWAF